MQTLVLETSSVPTGRSYKLTGLSAPVSWPQEDGTNLGMAGIWNLLFRAGANPVIVKVNDIKMPRAGEVLFVSADSRLSQETEIMLKKWLDNGGRIVASGNLDAFRFFLPADVVAETTRYDNPYAALAWIFGNTAPELIAPTKWAYAKILNQSDRRMVCHGRIAAVHGERQTPSRALITMMDDAPAITQIGNFWYFNGNPFAALQSWMQGQEDLEPWIAWRHRLFWLDEFCAYLCKTLRIYKLIPSSQLGVPGLAKTTVVLKHDLDFSRNTTYLDLENQDNTVGVYPILRDSNSDYWVEKLAVHPKHESAFHFNTAIYSRAFEAARNLLLNLPKRPMRPDRNGIQGTGLLKQVKWAKRQGVGIKTLHRHANFLLYPELVDALDRVYQELPEVLGGNSFFRTQVLRWGVNVVDGMRGTVGSFPDPQFPYWFPFRLAHAGHGGRMLRGWESTSMIELEPRLVEKLLGHAIPDLPQRVLVLNYHPAHTYGTTFSRQGSLSWFREVLEILHDQSVQIMTLSEVFQRCNNADDFSRSK